jgi:hypothetical protein
MPLDVKAILGQMDAILEQYEALRKSSQYEDCSDLEDTKITGMNSTLAAAIDRLAPPGSRYIKLQQDTLDHYGPTNGSALGPLAGILKSLRDDVAAGRLLTITELLHAEVFGDFLDMAQHLLDEGYKDPAAVLAGGALEEQLRKLCGKHGVPVMNGARPKKADLMNAELAAIPAYSKGDQKSVTAWLGLRNDAAHGRFGSYTPEQVSLLIQSVRDFITRVPA